MFELRARGPAPATAVRPARGAPWAPRGYAATARLALLLVLVAAGCSENGDAVVDSVTTTTMTTTTVTTVPTVTEPPTASAADECADVIDVIVRGDGTSYSFDTTVRSAETGWDKYADAWEVRAPDGSVLGVRELLHPHENEQPFTRSLASVEVPAGVTHVTVAARDSVLGFCGETYTVALPGRT